MAAPPTPAGAAPAPRHPLFARAWARAAPRLDHRAAPLRRRLAQGLSGRVADVGAGDGAGFAHLPASVAEMVAVEPEPHLRGIAAGRASEAPGDVEVIDGTAEALPLADGSVDAAVASLVLCSVTDVDAALGDIARVLRPGGVLRLFEHIAADGSAHRRLQRALDATVWPRVSGNCHTARDPLAHLAAHGLQRRWVERFRFPDSRLPSPTSPVVLAEAVAG